MFSLKKRDNKNIKIACKFFFPLVNHACGRRFYWWEEKATHYKDKQNKQKTSNTQASERITLPKNYSASRYLLAIAHETPELNTKKII